MRVGSAYALARAGAASILETGLSDLREEVRRCATWGLCALAPQLATPPLLRGCESDVTSVRKHAAFALGENGEPSAEVCAMLRALLLTDRSTWVRTAAAGALGCLGIRAAAQGQGAVVGEAVDALVQSLAQEGPCKTALFRLSCASISIVTGASLVQ